MKAPGHIQVSELGTRQVVLATLLVMGLVGVFVFLYRYSIVLLITFVALLLSTAIRPAVNWLNERGLSRPAGIITIYALGLIAVLALFIAILPILSEQIAEISAGLPENYSRLRDGLFLSGNRILHLVAVQLPPDLDSGLVENNEEMAATVEQVSQNLPLLDLVFGNLLTFLAVFILAFYWTLERERTFYHLLLWIPARSRERLREVIFELEEQVGRFLLGQGVLSIIVGMIAIVAYMLIGLPYALVLGVLAGIMELVPLVGPALGAIPAIIVALTVNPLMAFWVLVATALIQALENTLLVPRVMNRSVGVNPFIILLSLAVFSSLLGLTGAILAIPSAAILQALFNRFVVADDLDAPPGRDQLSLLRYKTQTLAHDIRKHARRRGQPSQSGEDILESMEATIDQLDRLLASRSEQGGAG